MMRPLVLLLVSAVVTCACAGCRDQREVPAHLPECSGGTRLTPEGLLEHAIPDAVHDPVPVPDDENASLPWLDAARRYEEINANDYQRVHDFICGIVGIDGPLPGGEKRQRLAGWLKEHTAVFELVDRAASMDRLQLPPYSEHDLSFMGWRYLAYLKALRARQYSAGGSWDDAVRDLNDILGLGIKLAEGDVVLIQFFLASAIQYIGLGEVRVVARNADTPDDAFERLLADVHPPDNLCEVWARVLRVEFTQFYIPSLAEYPVNAPLDVAWEWLREHESWGGRDTNEAILSLLRDHPCPFDPAGTARLVSQQVRRGADVCHLPWARAREHADEHPALSGGEKVLRALIDSEKPAPSVEALRKAREDLLRVKNPLGRQSVEEATYVSNAVGVFHLLASWRATRLVLLTESYRHRHGQPPPSLSDLDLAEDDLVTVDPFSGEVFCYDAERGLLWSVGENGVDDGGLEKPAGDDWVWKVTPRRS